MDAILQFTVNNQKLERTDEFIVVEGSENYLRAQFSFNTSDWDGLVKTAIFIDEDGDIHPSLCSGDICEVPKEWIVNQKGFVGIIGSDGSTKITTRAVKVIIKEKGYTSSGEIEEDAQAYFDKLIEAFAEKYLETEKQAVAASASEKSAEAWAHGHKEYPDRNEDNAAYYAGKAKEIASGIPGRVEVGKKSIDAYVQAREAELKGNTGNVYFAAFRVVNGRLMMYSDPSVDKVRFVRVGSRLKYRLAM